MREITPFPEIRLRAPCINFSCSSVTSRSDNGSSPRLLIPYSSARSRLTRRCRRRFAMQGVHHSTFWPELKPAYGPHRARTAQEVPENHHDGLPRFRGHASCLKTHPDTSRWRFNQFIRAFTSIDCPTALTENLCQLAGSKGLPPVQEPMQTERNNTVE